MPLFYIDTDDGDFFCRDAEGGEFRDVEAARKASLVALAEMAKDKLPSSDHRVLAIAIRAEDGAVSYTATLTLAGEWKAPLARDSSLPRSGAKPETER